MTRIRRIEDRLLKRIIIGVGYSDIHGVSALLVKVVNSNLQIIESASGSDEVQEFIRRQPHTPVCMAVDTSSVLYTTTADPVSESNISAVFQDFVPGGVESQFLIEFESHSLALARILALEGIEKELGLETDVVHACLMPVSALYLANFLKGPESTVHLDRFHFTFSGNQALVEAGSVSEETLEIEGEHISPRQVLPLVAVLNYLNPTTQKRGDQRWLEKYREYFFRKVFLTLRTPVLGVFLVIFLVNSLLFMSGDKRLREIREQSVFSNQVMEQIRKAEGYISERENLRKEMNGRKRYSIICDQLGYLSPANITLASVAINPLSKSRLSGQAYEQDVLLVVGYTPDPLDFIEWLEVLKKQGWVAEIADQKFENTAGGTGQFELKIRISNEWFEL